MTKVELEVKIQALQKLLDDKANEQTTYQNQINELQQKLDDLNKPKLTPMQFDAVNEAIETAIGQFDFDDEDNYSIDFGINYDGKVHCESFSFDNAYDLGQEIYNAVEELFAEAECPDEDDNQENQD